LIKSIQSQDNLWQEGKVGFQINLKNWKTPNSGLASRMNRYRDRYEGLTGNILRTDKEKKHSVF